ncbi:MAG: Lrp/AsnC family transcriptional regulator [Lewinellaceae bacterium]|nr:Lrp/AsnC family transcriptional regulator [Lewinellaceae bacterium]
MRTLDSIDFRILNLLQEDAKFTIKEIAAQLGMTTTPVYERIRRMEEDGYIKGYVALVDREKLDFQIQAFCNVSLKEHAREQLELFEANVQQLPEVAECYHIAGTFDYLLKVVVRDMNAYQEFMVNKLAVLENISNAQSSFVMSEVKYSTCLQLE